MNAGAFLGPLGYSDRHVASCGLVPIEAALKLAKALPQAILDDLRSLSARFPRGRCAFLRALHRDLEDLRREFSLQREVVLNLAKWLEAAGEFGRFLQSRLKD